MKELYGSEIAGFIKERHAHEVRALKVKGVSPKLVIIRTSQDTATSIYMRLKQAYGNDVGIVVEVLTCTEQEAIKYIEAANSDHTAHGCIVQLPLADPSYTDQLLRLVAPHKDVDGLAPHSVFQPATPTAIMWLLSGYNISLEGKKIVVVGQGRLVGAPLTALLRGMQLDVEVLDEHTIDPKEVLSNADVIITAVGKPRLITAALVKPGAVIVDAGVATDAGEVVGDVADDVRGLANISITPKKGGVGPLTITALFENVISAAKTSVQPKI